MPPPRRSLLVLHLPRSLDRKSYEREQKQEYADPLALNSDFLLSLLFLLSIFNREKQWMRWIRKKSKNVRANNNNNKNKK